ncbi:hypothetical protein BDZ89DRAFT_1224178, partial [Hymenopellis radicata]
MSNDDQRWETLEVEDEEARHCHLGANVRKLYSSRPAVVTSMTTFEFGDLKTFTIDILPQMEASNAILSQRLGGPQERGHRRHGAIHRRHGHGSDFEMGSSSSSLSDSEDDDDSDSSAEIITSHSASPRIIRPLPRRTPSGKAPQIVVLGSHAFASPSGPERIRSGRAWVDFRFVCLGIWTVTTAEAVHLTFPGRARCAVWIVWREVGGAKLLRTRLL